jgi:hypothetical protein
VPSPVDLETLRRRVARALDEVQTLPGFTAAFERIKHPPAVAGGWPWDAVVNATESDDWRPGTIRWVPASDNRADEAGSLVPSDEPLPEARERQLLSTYRAAVVEFGSSFVLDAQWSPRAVHDAIRLSQPVRLPQRPESFTVPPVESPLLLDPTEPMLASSLRVIGQALVAAADAAEAGAIAIRAPCQARQYGPAPSTR